MENYFQKIYSFGLLMITALFGEHWMLFVCYAALNIIDTVTGWIKARITNTESSLIGFVGVLKKLANWILIFIAFLIPTGFQELGKAINTDLSVTIFLGWFVLGTLIINELRSILENLVESGCNVPNILIKGLEIVSKQIKEVGEENE